MLTTLLLQLILFYEKVFEFQKFNRAASITGTIRGSFDNLKIVRSKETFRYC